MQLVLDNFINGAWVKSTGATLLDVTNPATGEVLAKVPLSPAADVDAAVKAAQAAFSRGETAYLSGKYDDATEAFKQAYASRPMPQFLYNIAAAFHLKGKKGSDPDSYDKAVEYYKRYLTEDKEAADKETVTKTIEILEAEAKRLRDATANPPPATNPDGTPTSV